MRNRLGSMLLLGLALCACTAVVQAGVTDPVGWWKFDDGSGTSAIDSSGNSHTGTLQGSPSWQTNGVAAGCLQFSTNDYVSVANWSGFDLTNQMAVSVWVKPLATGAAGPSFSSLVTKGDPYLDGWGLLFTTNSTALFQMTGQNGNSIASADTLPTNLWTHVVVSVSNDTVRLYLNGLLDRMDAWTGSKLVNTNGVSLGGRSSAGSLRGGLDDVRLYDHPLTDREVMQLFLEQDTDRDRLIDANERLLGTSVTNPDTDGDGWLDGFEVRAGTSPTTTNSFPNLTNNLVGFWKFNEGTGTTTADLTGNGGTGTLVNGTAWTTSGISSNAVAFDGIDDHIYCGGRPLAVTNLTLSYWAYVTNRSQVAGILCRADISGGIVQSGYLVLWDNTYNRITPMFHSSPTVPIELDDVLTNTWMHFAFSCDSSQIRSYLNGSLRASSSYSNTVGTSGHKLYLARPDQAPYSTNRYAGCMDDLRIYSRSVSSSYVTALAELDSDNDGLPDAFERLIGTDPLKTDTDGDGMPDGWEVQHGFDPANSSDGAQDADGDGLTNAQEYAQGTDPRNADTDGDGLPDGVDADPLNFDHSALSFTVTSPSNGTTIYP